MEFVMAIIILILAAMVLTFYCICVVSGRAYDLEEHEAADKGDNLKG